MIGRNIKLGAGLVILWGAGVWGAFWPSLSGELGDCRELTMLRENAERNDTGVDEVERVRSRLEFVRGEMGARADTIPKEASLSDLISSLSATLDRLGTHERVFGAEPQQRTPDAAYKQMELTIEGPFMSVYGAIDWLESLPRLVRISSVSVDAERVRNKKSPGDVFAKLKLDVFYDASPLGKDGKPVARADAGGRR